MTKKIKPCPFCGSSNIEGPHLVEYTGDNYAPYCWIECADCECLMENDGIDMAVIIDKWNRRAND